MIIIKDFSFVESSLNHEQKVRVEETFKRIYLNKFDTVNPIVLVQKKSNENYLEYVDLSLFD